MAAAPAEQGRLRSVLSGVGWFVGGVTGGSAYERYVEHLRRTHPECPVPSKRDFWREKYDEQERNPSTRCC